MLDQITPLILTYNEEANIGRTLAQLNWARDIVVVDSCSGDDTLEIVRSFPQARIVSRRFDSHAQQWNFGLTQTGIQTPWVMALDADFILSMEIIKQIETLEPADDVTGFRAPLVFRIKGRRLRSAVCPPATFLFRRESGEYFQDGHTQKLKLQRSVIESLCAPIFHDDRKSLRRWLASQQRYAELEAKKILTTPGRLDFADKVRRLRFVAPLAMGVYCSIWRGAILDGWPGIFYVCQRVVAELLLSLNLLEFRLHAEEKALAIEKLSRRTFSLLSWCDGRVACGSPRLTE